MSVNEAELDFAYRYPFSEEAKAVVASLNSSKIEQKYLDAGVIRVKQALSEPKIPFSEQTRSEMKLLYTLSYVYSRMLVSALASDPINAFIATKYAIAEARRVGEAVGADRMQSLDRVARELGMEFRAEKELFVLPFSQYLSLEPKSNKEYSLIHQQLDGGMVYLTKSRLVRLIEEGAKRAILKGLPIERRYLPKEILESVKKIPVPKPKITSGISGAGYEWIEKLIEIPLPDFRHRAVNLILAPYFANVKNLPEDQAIEAVMDYINKCKALNPHTDITESYVKYQVTWAKKRGLKPYSLARAKSLIGDAIDFGDIEKKDEKKEEKEPVKK
ncbi:MAG: DNA primase noncatalytic subunit PriX [Candidatus Micrarchaeota archaeon]|nr:DNA primase noncatalytic subunit PriX [Candidatus Micrarchaeota archaeon]